MALRQYQYDIPFEDEVELFFANLAPKTTWEYGSSSCGHANLNDKREMELDIVQGVSLDTCSTAKDLEERPKDFQVHLDLNNGTPNQEESAKEHKKDTIDESEK